MEAIDNSNVWFVTGTSSGIGLSLVKKLLINGYKVSALTRKPEELKQQVLQISNHVENLLIVKTDITNDESVKNAVDKTIERFGKIDVVVNNAGYGLIGALEEVSDKEVRAIYDVNVFGVINILRHTTPHLRKQRSGIIINVSSILGWTTMANYYAYCSTKHAVNAITFSAQKELKEFNVKVILASPGGFRTGFVVSETTNFQIPKSLIDDYKTNQLIEVFNKYSPLTNGDPEKAADILIKLTNLNEVPDNLFMGSDSLSQSKKHLEQFLNENEKWAQLSISSDIDKDK
ncbi:short-chain dehydrogenase/reductase family protein [Dictyostelium discoideum AX4]|uniref:Short-chain dehydrogenase/reductase family protein n=1 Tax=Dictyostelium discoideum TaxID=44689 RepID=Q559N8_DICDI|nr:short-chain dehydrogenase/reductase family protein [Dictyostelium discoideum AX4]EAL71385.1 short-chain dehydrogenase/reductase family protein [Dictyostelium discoideum AX4]|eukprot:XP_645296.1 short-chain dehydrogenase/reductase family protein [Dictyostelium discoideum AX4]